MLHFVVLMSVAMLSIFMPRVILLCVAMHKVNAKLNMSQIFCFRHEMVKHEIEIWSFKKYLFFTVEFQ
jgi:hypothetical protein